MTQTNGRMTIRQGLAMLSCLAALFVGVGGTRADAQTNAYVAKTALNAVDVIDTGTNTVVNTVPVGVAPTQVAISQDGTRAYVANTGAFPYTISVIDTKNPGSPLDPFAVGNQPSSIAVDSTRNQLYVLEAGGVLEVLNATSGVLLKSLNVGGSDGQIAVTPDGSHVYVAAGNVIVIRTDDNSIVTSFAPEETPTAGVSNLAVAVAISPTEPRAYISVVTYYYDFLGFHAGGGLAVVDTTIVDAATVDSVINPVTQTIPLFSLPGSIAFTADGSRAYVGIKSYWADTLYGAGFLPGRWVATIDTKLNAVGNWIDLGADGSAWSQQHTPAGIAVAPDRSAVFVSIPSNNSVAVIDPATDLLKDQVIAVAGAPNGVAVIPDPSAPPTPFELHATDDVAPNPLPAQHAALAVANVLANDTIGGAQAAIGNVTLSVASPTSASLTLNTDTGAVFVAADAAIGTHTLTYQICEPGNSQVCAQATATVSVRERYAIATTDDRATSLPGATAIANVVANDVLGAGAASLATVAVIPVSSDAALSVNAATGSVVVAAGAARGDHVLTYRICEIADPDNCSPTNGTATVTVVWRDIHAELDNATISRSGGIAIANVLANDTFDGAPATLSRVTVSAVSASAGVTLNAATGAVSVAQGTAVGPQSLVYSICETANPANCSQGTATVTVNAYVVNAVADRARASSKTAMFGVINVLANDTLGGSPATDANVTLSLVSLSPPNRQIRLNSNGSVDVLGKSSSGTYFLQYRICEIADPTNCAQATLTLDLSGKQ